MQFSLNTNRTIVNRLVICAILVASTTGHHQSSFAQSITSISSSLKSNSSSRQFRGNQEQGHASPDAKPPLEFNLKKNLKWKTPILGRGFSSPVILDNEIWLTTAYKGGKSLRLLCFHTETGEKVHNMEVFKIKAPKDIHKDNSYASPTPIVDAQNIYAHFGRYGTVAVERKSGRIIWKRSDLKVEHQGGPGSSPVEFKDLIILNLDGADEAYVIALNKKDGTTAWKRNRSAPFRENRITHRAFSSPIIISHHGKPLLISIGADQAHAYNPANGDEIWHVRYTGFSNVPAPISDDKHVYICTGFFTPQLLAVQLGGKDEITGSHVAWKFTEQVTTIPSPILVEGLLYMISEKGILNCIDSKNGERVWRSRVPGKFSASPIYAGKHIFLCAENGRVTVFKPSREKFELVFANKVGNRIKASPVAINNSLFIRTDKELLRFDNNGEKTKPATKQSPIKE